MVASSIFAAPILLTCVSWLLRFLMHSQGVLTDLVVIACVAVVRHHRSIRDGITTNLPVRPFHITLGLIGLGITFFTLRTTQSKRRSPGASRGTSDSPKSNLRPMLFPCRTTHTRLFPTVHKFSYSYLYAGVPIGWTGSAGTLLSADNLMVSEKRSTKSTTRAWFSVEAEDYLQRGRHPEGLKGKLRDYLDGQGVPASRYSYAYLVTAPRFCGFSFNPVSFWYLYSSEKELKAMILEVNNTFDERRIYLLEDVSKTQSHPTIKNPLKFDWPKDFHVSPFNARDGSYSVTANDPFSSDTHVSGHVDCNIVLLSNDSKPKIVARVHSTDDPLVAEAASGLATLHFVLKWWWVGFMTNPRILREARKLWVKGLQVFYRPEVLLGSIGRTDTYEERVIERYFSEFLKTKANVLRQPITYVSAAGPTYGLVQHFGPDPEQPGTSLRIQVLTPAFYAEIVRLGSAERGVELFGSSVMDSGRLVHTSDDQLCRNVLKASHEIPAKGTRFSILGLMRASDRLSSLWNLLRHGKDGPYLSELDYLVIERQYPSWVYFKASMVILTCDKIAFGYKPLLKAYGLLLWSVACLYASHLFDWFDKIPPWSSQYQTVFGNVAVHGISLLYRT